jgi:hypothetical protein
LFLMFIVCYYLFFITHSSSLEHSIGQWAYQSLVIAICFLCLVLFWSGNVALASFPINNMNKGRWMQDKHKIFMQEYEKYGNNCMQIARVLSTWTPAYWETYAWMWEYWYSRVLVLWETHAWMWEYWYSRVLVLFTYLYLLWSKSFILGHQVAPQFLRNSPPLTSRE